MDISKSSGRFFYEELRLLTKDTFEAIFRLKRLCTNKNTHYVIINDHIGDIIIALGYLREFRKSKKINNLTLVVTDKYKEIVKYYSTDYDEIIYVLPYDLYRIFLLNVTNYGEKYLLKIFPNVTLINPADSSRLGFDYIKRFPEMNLEKLIKYGCYELLEKASFVPLKDIDTCNALPKNALLTIESRTVDIGSLSLYEKLVPLLESLGYQVYTNTKDINICIKGTRPIYISIDELREFIGTGVIIGTRSGLHDLLLYQRCKVVAIYPKAYEFYSLFSLETMPNTTSLYKELIQSDNDDADCKLIMDFIRG